MNSVLLSFSARNVSPFSESDNIFMNIVLSISWHSETTRHFSYFMGFTKRSECVGSRWSYCFPILEEVQMCAKMKFCFSYERHVD